MVASEFGVGGTAVVTDGCIKETAAAEFPGPGYRVILTHGLTASFFEEITNRVVALFIHSEKNLNALKIGD